METKRRVPMGRLVGGILFALVVFAARLPNTMTVIRDAQGQSTGQTRYNPAAVGWLVSLVSISLACIILGGRSLQIFGFVLLTIVLFM